MTRYLRQADLLGQAAITPEEAAANKLAGKGPRRPRPGKTGRYAFSSATLWRMVRSGSFPAPVRLSAGVTAWRLDEIEAFEQASNTAKPPPPSANLRAAWAGRSRTVGAA